MITEDYVSFEVAKMLKEKGFDELCIFKYNSEGVRVKAGVAIEEWQNSELDDDECSCVSHQMAMKWLREEHNLCIEIFVTWRDKIPHYQWRINNLITQDTIVDTPCLEKPEQAVEAALKYALENLI